MVDYSLLKESELEILNAFHAVCETHGLKYVIAFGTMIGCVRHKGFIPWDDDIDVAMPYDDYMTFLKNGQEWLGNRFLIHDKTNDKAYKHPFFEIKLVKSCLLTTNSFVSPLKSHGIYMDVFPVMYLPRSKKLKNKISRSNRVWGQIYRTIGFYRVKETKKGIIGKVILLILLALNKILPRDLPIEKCYSNALKANASNSDELYIADFSYPTSMEEFALPKDVFENRVLMPFEDIQVYMPAEYDPIMKKMYGDYMKLPPENERKTHNFYFMSATESYDECVAHHKIP